MRGGTGPRNTLTEVSGWRAGGLLPAVLIAVAMVVGGALANGAAAQGTVVIGGDGRSGVEIDLGAIDGPASGAFDVRLGHVGSPNPNAPVRLRPPRGGASGATAAPAMPVPRMTLTPPAPSVPAADRVRRPPLPVPAVAARTVSTPAKRATAAPLPPPVVPPRPAAITAPRVAPPRPVATAAPPVVAKPPVAPVAAIPPTRKPPPVPPARAPAPPATKDRPPSPVAALPQVKIPTGGGHVLRLTFGSDSSSLGPSAEAELKSLAGELSRDTARLELKAYAGEANRTASAARRLSLSRALAVRSFLIEQGIRSTRIGVRAFGFPTDGGPTERVDLVLLAR